MGEETDHDATYASSSGPTSRSRRMGDEGVAAFGERAEFHGRGNMTGLHAIVIVREKRTIQYAVTYRLDGASLELTGGPAFRGACGTQLRKYAGIPSEPPSRSRGRRRAFASASNFSRTTQLASAPDAAPRTSALSSQSNLRLMRQRCIGRSCRAISHIANEAIAAIALTRRFGNKARNQHRRAGQFRDNSALARNRSARQVLLRGLAARTCSMGRLRGNRRSPRCGCRFALRNFVRERDFVSIVSEVKCSGVRRVVGGAGNAAVGQSWQARPGAQ